uniref:hypothetical protein n=1 Tax=Altererythrobacter segetis TaxID=1104773 RepID=UPI00140E7D0F
MLLSISTTHSPASDLGFLLMKNPENVHDIELPFGRATLFYPEADDDRRAILSFPAPGAPATALRGHKRRARR